MSYTFDDDGFARREITPEVVDAYRRISEGESSPTDSDVVRLLRDVGLVVPRLGQEGGLMLVDPHVVLPAHRDALYREAKRRMDAADAIPALERLLAQYYREAQAEPSNVGIERPNSLADVNSRIGAILANATNELITAQTAHREPDNFESSYRRDFEAMRRGVKMKTLYLESEREYDYIAEWVQAVTREGGEVRTLPRLFMRAIIIDRQIAIISDRKRVAGPAAIEGAAVIIHDEGVVGELVAQFERDWSQARVWAGDGPSEAAVMLPVVSEVQQQVLTGIAEGLTRKAIGVRMASSTRSIERVVEEIKAIVDPSGAPVSQAQMTYWWGRMERGM